MKQNFQIVPEIFNGMWTPIGPNTACTMSSHRYFLGKYLDVKYECAELQHTNDDNMCAESASENTLILKRWLYAN